MDRHQELNGPATPGAEGHAPETPSANPVKRLRDLHQKGPSSLINLSLYAFGLSGLWTALGTPILPVKVEQIIDDGSVTILGVTLKENGLLGMVSLIGLAVAAIAQVTSGVMSDRTSGAGKRLPFIMLGACGMAVCVLFIGLVQSAILLIVVNVLVQLFGNMGQGPANALIADHVTSGKKGQAAGALNLARVAGAGTVTALVLLLMSNYDSETSPQWIWVSLSVMAIAAVTSTAWTVNSLRGRAHVKSDQVVLKVPPPLQRRIASASNRDNKTDGTYLRFLVALGFVISAMSALQIYSFFYLEDVIGLENASQGGLLVLLTTGVATALTVLPAGRLTDSVGRNRMLYVAGALGVLASLILIVARSVLVVALDGALMGIVIGIFLTVSWTVANDLVRQRNAARDLGYASIAVFVGSAVSRLAGLGVDRLNDIHSALGYQVVLVAVAISFVVSVAMITRIERTYEPLAQQEATPPDPQAAGRSA